jgi:hypothetical protein
VRVDWEPPQREAAYLCAGLVNRLQEGVPSREGLVKAAQGAQRLRGAALDACCGRGEVCAQLTSFSGIDEASLSQDSSLRFH